MVELPGRLISQQQTWSRSQGPRQGNALGLAAHSSSGKRSASSLRSSRPNASSAAVRATFASTSPSSSGSSTFSTTDNAGKRLGA
jgi:hypothetical protein